MAHRFFPCFVFLVILSASVANDLRGQEPDLVALEKTVKEAQNGYMYAEEVGNTKEEALAAARNMLRPMVETDEIKKKYTNWKDIVTCVLDSAKYFTKPRGNKTRAVVYLLKSELPGSIEKCSGLTLAVAPKPESPPPVDFNDDNKDALIKTIMNSPDDYLYADATGSTQGKAVKTAQEKLGRPIMRVMAEYPAINLDSEMVESIAYDTESIAQRQGNVFYALAYIKLSTFHCNLKRGVISGRSTCGDEGTVKVDTVPVKEENNNTRAVNTGNSTAEIEPAEQKASPLLDEIMVIKTINKLRDVFIANKNKGKLAYGQPTTMSNPESSYLVVYNHIGEILTFYGKGGSARKNLQTGKVERYDEAYPEGKVMWFQLYE